MNTVLALGKHLSKLMDIIGGTVLALMMLLTVVDIAMRYLGVPFMGTYELVAMAGAVVIGFGFPQTTMDNANVTVDFLVEGAPRAARNFLLVCTKIMGIVLFAAMGYGLIAKAIELQSVNEASLTLRMPLSPLAYALGACSFVESLALACVLIKGLCPGGANE
jgi:TRAP-type C4-dicarboxylate transport system permease small subunit